MLISHPSPDAWCDCLFSGANVDGNCTCKSHERRTHRHARFYTIPISFQVQSNNNDVLDDTSWTQFGSNNGEAFRVSTRKLVNLQPWPPPSQWRSEVFSLCAAGGQGLNFSWKCISEGKLMLWTNVKVIRREYTNKVLWLSVANSWDLIWAVLQQLLCTSELILQWNQHGQTHELLLQREQLKLGAVHLSLEASTFSKNSRGIELVKCSERCLICLVCEDNIVLHTWAYRVVKLVDARLVGDQGKTIQFLAIWEFANKEVALIQTKKHMHVSQSTDLNICMLHLGSHGVYADSSGEEGVKAWWLRQQKHGRECGCNAQVLCMLDKWIQQWAGSTSDGSKVIKQLFWDSAQQDISLQVP